ncbi:MULTISPECIES: NUDIX hydrolase [Microbacterium]|uniref:NUDIX hydrolase n=1 Tax=Microbacterium TaxID=33882 RepID=UPI0022F24CFF|nr:NUDIX domain-containing protein [Microbacterium barkeri]MDI6943884.1 NUDIX domain-containing protein [Microbacterium barkeri]MDR6876964.1 8-oxo-dGTP diphosphatase [Microbacterium barkeri]
MTSAHRPVYAAGCVVWRELDGELLVLLVHRGKYRDISLPKGKLDPGEMLAETAVREIHEETGLRVSLGPSVGQSVYIQPSGREKIVHYWAAEATQEAIRASTFVPNKEIAGLEWVTVGAARKRLSYPVDQDILDRFERLRRAASLRTFPVVVLRHGKAVARDEWGGEDAARPLQTRGKEQAKAIVGALRAFGVRKIVSSDAERCVKTVTPLSKAIGRRIVETPLISEDAWDAGTADAREVVGRRVRSGKPAVICSHRPVIPALMRELALATGTVHGPRLESAAGLDPGAFAVVHLSATNPGAGIVAIETHAPGV